MMSLSDDTQADIIEAFNSTFRYLDNLSNINNPYFEGIVTQIYLTDLQLNKATVATFLDLYLLIWNGFVSSKINGKCNDFDFDIVYFPFLGGDVPQAPPPPPPPIPSPPPPPPPPHSCEGYISQLIGFARVSKHLADFNACNKTLTAKLLQMGNPFHNLGKLFLSFIVNTTIDL